MWFILLQVVLVLTLCYWYLRKTYSFWSDRDVNGPTPWPIVGNFHTKMLTPPDQFEWNLARRYGKIYGMFYGLDPVLTVTDHELIKQILIKDFALVSDRRQFKTYHEVINRHLFAMKHSDGWKRVRTIVTPSFTTGKLRGMHALMSQCIDKLDRYFDNITSGSKKGTFDARPVFAGLTIDVIASTVFATETNANDDRSQANPFLINGMRLFQPSAFKVLVANVLPRAINNLLGVKTQFPSDPVEFYIQLCRQIVRERKANPVQRNDLIQVLMQSYAYDSDVKDQNYDKLTATGDYDETESTQSNTEKTKHGAKQMLTEDEIVAQCFIFFIAGFETTATTLGFCVYELTQNPEVQERLHDEIMQVLESGDYDRSSEKYHDLVSHHIPYLDAVIKETLRKYPPVLRIQRCVVTENYKLAGIPLPKGLQIEIPNLVVHYNPDYYPNPHCFEPERWMPENKHLLVPYTYLPFGDGPRNCVGMRFAYQEIKLALAHLLTKYRFEPNSRTPEKCQFRADIPLLAVKELPVSIVRRD